MNATLKEAKTQADRLTARLRDLGVPLKRTQALEAVAAVHDFTDWNRYQAHLERNGGTAPEPALHLTTSPPTAHRILLMRPGEGKSSILALMLADEMRTARGIPVWIDCNSGSPSSVLPAFVAEQVSRIDVTFDGEHIDLPEPPLNARGIWISLTGPQGDYSIEHRRIRTRAFCALAEALRTSWPASLITRFSLTLIDETSRLDETDPALFGSAIPTLAFNGAQVIVATQHLQQVPSCPLDFELISTKQTISQLTFRDSLNVDIDKIHIADAARMSKPSLYDDTFTVDEAAHLIAGTLSGVDYGTLDDTPRGWLFRRMIDAWRSSIPTGKNASALRSFLRTARERQIVIDGEQELMDRLVPLPDWRVELVRTLIHTADIRLWCSPVGHAKHRDDFLRDLMAIYAISYPDADAICSAIRPTPSSKDFIAEIKDAGIVIEGEMALAHLLSGAGDEWCAQLTMVFRTARKHGIYFTTPTSEALEQACSRMMMMHLTDSAISAFKANYETAKA